MFTSMFFIHCIKYNCSRNLLNFQYDDFLSLNNI
uniref:Uncharacterized protein n=1 Tax=Arundo donax TaxID=35708 RepID=A0A0A9BA82_ARUDO